MLSNFDIRTLKALNSIRVNNPTDFEIVMETLTNEVARMDNMSRTCKDDITYRWNQGGTQALSDFVTQAQGARDTVLQLRDNAEESARDSRNDLRARAIG